MSEFFERLRHVAFVTNKFQADVSLGISKDRATVSKWWNGGIVPGPRNMRLLADYFGCNQRWLETGEGEPFQPPPDQRPTQEIMTELEEGAVGSAVAYHSTSARSQQIAKSTDRHDTSKQGSTEGALPVKELLADALDVLESDNVYRQALATNIRAFKQAVVSEAKMKSTDEKIDQMMEQINTLTTIIMQSQATLDTTEKKRVGENY